MKRIGLMTLMTLLSGAVAVVYAQPAAGGNSGQGSSSQENSSQSLPPGLQNREQLPPGLRNREELPPGLQQRQGGALTNSVQPGLAGRVGTQSGVPGNPGLTNSAGSIAGGATSQRGLTPTSTPGSSQRLYGTNSSGVSTSSQMMQDRALTAKDRTLLTQVRTSIQPVLGTQAAATVTGARGAWAPVHLSINQGVVTLVGNVTSAEQKTAIEQRVERIPGVVRVVNQLSVRQSSGVGGALDTTGGRTNGASSSMADPSIPITRSQFATNNATARSRIGTNNWLSPTSESNRTNRTYSRTNLPPGLRNRDQLPPGLEKRDELPPGLQKRTGATETNEGTADNLNQ